MRLDEITKDVNVETKAAVEHSNLKMLGVMRRSHKEELRSGQ